MSGPQRIDLGAVGEPGPRLTKCPGAMLVVDRASYRDLERNGVRIATRVDAVPAEGRADVRVACEADEEVVHRNGTTYRTGRCAACATMEKAQREQLKAQRGDR